MRALDRLLYALIILAIICAIFVAGQRISVERRNNHVEIAVDFTAVNELALQNGIECEELVMRLKGAGMTALAFSEDTLTTLRLRGLINWYQGRDLKRVLESGLEKLPGGMSIDQIPPIIPSKLYVTVYDNETFEQLDCFLPLFTGHDNARVWARGDSVSEDSPAILEATGAEEPLSLMGLGFSRQLVRKYRDLGLNIILRPESKKAATRSLIEEYTEILKRFQPIHTIIFAGADNDVLGYPDNLESAAEMIHQLGCHLGNIEAPNVKAMQKGIQTVSSKCVISTLRVQSLPPLLQDRLTIDDAVDKFDLGVRERNIRVLYLRPFIRPYKDMSLIDTNIYYFKLLRDSLTGNHFIIGNAEGFPDFKPGKALVIIMGLGAYAAFLLLLRRIISISDFGIIILLALWLLGTGLFLFTDKMPLWRKLSALGGGLVFPALAFILNFGEMKKPDAKRTFPALAAASTLILLRITLLTFLGGLIVCGLLSSTEFFLQIDRFRGIKLLMIIPPIFVVLYYTAVTAANPRKLRDLLQIPIYVWHLIVLCILGGAGAYYIVRTGNAAPSATSSFELSLRSLLDKVLLVRPRFKEFLMAYPALMLAIGMLKSGNEPWIWLILLAAGVGQADILDTLAHLHTPLSISLLRLLNGFILGLLIGWAVLYLFWKTLKKGKKE